ncbi:L-amino acid amidase [Termitomyces sp. T112]|nr:L-amino acid amidase [Termitomyces sp. T112]KAH0584352.1 hypothetical protein H2248_009892 [Termitomyces sp. 'cryptogamus']
MTTTTGKINFQYQGVTYQTWYKLFGNLQSAKAGVRPLIALHGGPGVSHSYMTPHADLFASHGIPVILYDQIGGGESSHYRDAPKEFWTVELFMDELENLLNHFGISGDYDLVGHSWGGMLAANFAAARQPVGLKHLVVADTPASMALWEQSTASLVEQLPQDVQDVIKKHETAGTTDTPEYQEAMLVFYKKHVCRLETWPDALNASFAAMEADPTVYHTMQGPSEFTITGTLKTWNIIDILPNIKVSTLIINSVYDEAQDICMLPFFNNIPKVKWVQFANSSHVPLFEEPERYKKVVGDFLMTA